MHSFQFGWFNQTRPKKLIMSTNSLNNQLNISSCNTLSSESIPCNTLSSESVPCNTISSKQVICNMQDFQCNNLNIDIDLCQNDLFYPPLITDLYFIPVNVFHTCVTQNSVNCNVIGSDRSEANKKLMKQKFTYPRVDPEDSGIIDNRSDHQKMSSILRICSQILSKDELEVWNDLTK
jgi:hypothetical protein